MMNTQALNLSIPRHPLVWLIILASFLFLIVSALEAPFSYDHWWHLQLATDWVESGLSPWIDHRSYTYLGEQVSKLPVAYELALYGATDLFGESGGKVFITLACYTAIFILGIAWLRAIDAPPVVWLLLFPLLVCALHLRNILRPEIITYPLCFLALLLYQRTQLKLSLNAMWPVVLLLALWSAYHTPVLGYIIFFGLFIDIAVRLVKEKPGAGEWAKWCAWGLLLVLAGFANPEGSHFVSGFFSGASGSVWDQYIWEYRSVFFLHDRWPVWVLGIVALSAIALAIKHQRVGYFVILLVLIYGSVNMMRLVTPGGIIGSAIFVHLLSLQFVTHHDDLSSETVIQKPHAPLLLLLVLSLVALVYEGRRLAHPPSDSVEYFPFAMTDYMRETEREGNLFHLFRLGGFLMYKLAPESAVYIDGRTNILYPIEHYERYLNVMLNPQRFRQEVEQLNISYAVMPATDEYVVRLHNGGFELDFSDLTYVLFSREGGNFPLMGKLWAQPQCWSNESLDTLARESRKAIELLPENARLMPLASYLSTVTQADNPSQAISQYPEDGLRLAHFVRIHAYSALANAQYETALYQFGRLTNLPPKDRLAVVMARLRAGDVQGAHLEMEGIIGEISTWRNLEPMDLAILRALLDELASNGDLPYLSPQLDTGLTAQVGKNNLKLMGQPLSFTSFCTHNE